MLTGGEVFPLSDNGGVCFKIEICFAFFHLAALKDIEKGIKDHRVKPRVPVFGANSNKSEVNDVG